MSADAPDRDALIAMAVQVTSDGVLAGHIERRIALRADELEHRRRAQRLRAGGRTADNVAKFGGGSLLTATVALLISGSTDWLVVGVAVLTLLSFLIATMFGAAFDIRAIAYEHDAERIAAVLKETQ